MAWQCRYLRDETATWFPSETKLDTRLYECEGDQVGAPPITYEPSPDPAASDPVTATPGAPGTPAAPGGPGRSQAWSEVFLAWISGDDEPQAASSAPRPPGGCCAEGRPRCLACFLKQNGGWLLIAALAVAAFLLRKRP